MSIRSSWGLLPADAIARLRRLEWDNATHLKARLLGERAFPIRLSLQAPTASQAMADLTRFRLWVSEWKAFLPADSLEWQQRRYRQLGDQRVPRALTIATVSELAAILGQEPESRAAFWEPVMSPLLALIDQRQDPDRYRALYVALVSRLDGLERLSFEESELLASLLPQLRAGMGEGQYLRALPLKGVDTKFLELQRLLVADLLDVLHAGALSEAGGLYRWLGCEDNPRGWLVIKPLCDQTRASLGGLPLLQLPAQHLMHNPLPAKRLLVVENLQSGLGLPELTDTIAVVGGGRNVAWMAASWLEHYRVGYWGDIDTWGLQILADARSHCPHLQALMMDGETLLAHRTRMVDEPEPCTQVNGVLDANEQQLLESLRDGGPGQTRLEQERLSADWISTALNAWAAS